MLLFKKCTKNATGQWMHPKSFAATTCNHTCLLVATPRHFWIFRHLTQNQTAVTQNQTATVGPMVECWNYPGLPTLRVKNIKSAALLCSIGKSGMTFEKNTAKQNWKHRCAQLSEISHLALFLAPNFRGGWSQPQLGGRPQTVCTACGYDLNSLEFQH